MEDKNEFSEYVYIQQIQNRLWKSREFGHASVMIGAGFSCNASNPSNSSKKFPLWEDLAKKLYFELGKNSELSDLALIKNLAFQVTHLASEYEATHNRFALNQLIRQEIPDLEYKPEKIHDLLLNLPWADVFTTNWDTLLERTLDQIYDKSYSVIQSLKDIPDSNQPRIIKLHGSFPSTEPFIITEEDYRTYPKNFAPFVNMVRQSIVENAFCLMGFSSNDPNFMQWIGWVRDNFQDYKPPIYLIGVLDLSLSEKLLLQKRGITPIDLGSLFTKKEYDNADKRYQSAIEWFLEELKSFEPLYRENWPNNSNKTLILTDENNTEKELFAKFSINSEFENKYYLWKKQRFEYPGWLILPHQNRKNLFPLEFSEIFNVCNFILTLEPPLNLLYLYELNWRMEKALIPIFPDICQIFLNIFYQYDKIFSDREKQFKFDSSHEFILKWMDINLNILQYCRNFFLENEFETIKKSLEKYSLDISDYAKKISLETAYYAYYHLDLKETLLSLENWPNDSGDCFIDVKRASLFAELGEISKSKEIAQKALNLIRSQIANDSDNIYLISQESYAMFLIHSLSITDFSNFSKNQEERFEYIKRWSKIQKFNCDPNEEMDYILLELQKETYQQKNREKKYNFDPGSYTLFSTFSSSRKFSSWFSSLSFLKFLEDGAFPFYLKNVNVEGDYIIKASEKLTSINPLLFYISFIRTGKLEEIEQKVSKIKIYCEDIQNIEYIYNNFIKSLNYCIYVIKGKEYEKPFKDTDIYYRLINIILNFLSKISFRLNDSQRKNLIDSILPLENNNIFKNNCDPINNLCDSLFLAFRRIITSCNSDAFSHIFPTLLRFGIPEHNNFQVCQIMRYPEISSIFYEFPKISLSRQELKIDDSISELISLIKNGNVNTRLRALSRILYCYHNSLLSTDEIRDLTQAIWYPTDHNLSFCTEEGLKNRYITSNYFLLIKNILELPNIEKTDYIDVIKQFLLYHPIRTSKQPLDKARNTIPPQILDQNYFYDLKFSPFSLHDENYGKLIVFSEDEVILLINRIIDWWDSSKIPLNLLNQPLSDSNADCDIKSELNLIRDTFSSILLPVLSHKCELELKNKIDRFFKELEKSGINISQLYTMSLHIFPNNFDYVVKNIRAGFFSLKSERVFSSIISLKEWIIFHNMNNNYQNLNPPDDLLQEWINQILSRWPIELDQSIRHLNDLILNNFSLFDQISLNKLILALEYLINDTAISHLDISVQSLGSDRTHITSGLKPTIRSLCTKMASTIYYQYSKENIKIPDILLEWKTIAIEDPLPEIRNSWTFE